MQGKSKGSVHGKDIAGRQSGRQAGKSIAITTNSRNGRQFEMRITFYVFAGVFHLVFLHFPLFHFATFLFWSSFFIAAAVAVAVAVAAQGWQGSVSIALLNMFTAISCMKYMSLCRPGAQRGLTRRSMACAIDPGN